MVAQWSPKITKCQPNIHIALRYYWYPFQVYAAWHIFINDKPWPHWARHHSNTSPSMATWVMQWQEHRSALTDNRAGHQRHCRMCVPETTFKLYTIPVQIDNFLPSTNPVLCWAWLHFSLTTDFFQMSWPFAWLCFGRSRSPHYLDLIATWHTPYISVLDGHSGWLP